MPEPFIVQISYQSYLVFMQVKALWVLKFDSKESALGPYGVGFFTSKQVIVPSQCGKLVLQ